MYVCSLVWKCISGLNKNNFWADPPPDTAIACKCEMFPKYVYPLVDQVEDLEYSVWFHTSSPFIASWANPNDTFGMG